MSEEKPCNAKKRHVKGNKIEAENHAMQGYGKQRETKQKQKTMQCKDAASKREQNKSRKPCNVRMQQAKGNKTKAENHAMQRCGKQRETK